MSGVSDWFDGDGGVDEEVVVDEAMRFVVVFVCGGGFDDDEFSDAGEAVGEEDAGWW